MNLKPIDPKKLLLNSIDLWTNPGMLLTVGDFAKEHFNTMTIGWGSIGVMWRKPFIQVVVRPTRYTYDFIEQYDTFTVCAFPRKFRKALMLLGTISGRDTDKIKESGLNPIPSTKIAAPSFMEAELIFECRKLYWDDFKPEHFLDPNIEELYPKKDYHRTYFGEIIEVLGDDKYTEKYSE